MRRLAPTTALRLAGHAEIGLDVQRLADARRLARAAGDDPRTLLCEQARGLEADAGGRAGHEADAVAQAEIHRPLAYPA